MQLRESEYIQIAGKLGLGKWEIAKKTHSSPMFCPSLLLGWYCFSRMQFFMSPVLHFWASGFPRSSRRFGVILSESMRYLIMGKWWLAVFPGMMLVLTVVLFEKGGTALRQLLDPGSVHK